MTARVLAVEERMLVVAVRAVMAVWEGSATVASEATMCGRAMKADFPSALAAGKDVCYRVGLFMNVFLLPLNYRFRYAIDPEIKQSQVLSERNKNGQFLVYN
jgi:hypothetical protein